VFKLVFDEKGKPTYRRRRYSAPKCFHVAMRRGRKIAKVAMARKLAIHLYWMWREGWEYEQWNEFGSHAGEPGNSRGVQ
jgi:hypothetical protein